MKPEEPRRHDRAADAVHEGRPVKAEYVRSGRPGRRVLVILTVSTITAAVGLLALWAASNGIFASQDPTDAEEAAAQQAFDTDTSYAPPPAERP